MKKLKAKAKPTDSEMYSNLVGDMDLFDNTLRRMLRVPPNATTNIAAGDDMNKQLTWDGLKKYLADKWPEYLSPEQLGKAFGDEAKAQMLADLMVDAGDLEKRNEPTVSYRANRGDMVQCVKELMGALQEAWSLMNWKAQRSDEANNVRSVMEKHGIAATLKTSPGPGPGRPPARASGRTGPISGSTLSLQFRVCKSMMDVGNGQADVVQISETLANEPDAKDITIERIQKCLSNLSQRKFVKRTNSAFPYAYQLTATGRKYWEELKASAS